MHNGRFRILEEVIDFYNDIDKLEEPRDHGEIILVSIKLDDREKKELIAFLHSLTDEGPESREP